MEWSVVLCDAMRYYGLFCGAKRHDGVQNDAMPRHAMLCGVMVCSGVTHDGTGPVRCYAVISGPVPMRGSVAAHDAIGCYGLYGVMRGIRP